MLDNALSILHRCFESSHRRTYPPNTTIINAGDYSNSLYYIASGSVSVILEDQDGHEMVLAYLNEGEFFGDNLLEFDEGNYTFVFHLKNFFLPAASRLDRGTISAS